MVPVMVGGKGERKTLRAACSAGNVGDPGTDHDRIRRTVMLLRPFDAASEAAGFLAEIRGSRHRRGARCAAP